MQENNEKLESYSEPGLGELLRQEREKRGLSREQVAGITKLREPFINAMENEDWEKLPSPVFVKGFIRSYAQVLGMDGREAVRMFERIAPVKEQAPKPLAKEEEPKRKFIYFLIPLIAVVAVVLYIYSTYLPEDSPTPATQTVEQGESLKGTETVPAEAVKPGVPEETETVPKETAGEASPEKSGPASEGIAGEKAPEEAGTALEETAAEETRDGEGTPYEIASTESPGETEVTAEESGEPDVANNYPLPTTMEERATGSLLEGSQANDELVLTGIVHLRTYLKIYVDDNPPKEYIFQPGSRPQWRAKKGFNVILGNAAGMEFDLNGKRLKDFGRLGKVVRLSFPEDFESRLYEE